MSLPFMEKDGYFCSELIGVLYQELGLFKKSKDLVPSNMLPKDFDGKKLESVLNTTMSFEYVILFNNLL
jgi:hypothetical protein